MTVELSDSDRKLRAFTYLQYIASVESHAYEACLRAVQDTLFAKAQPPEFALFAGCFAHIGIDHLGLLEEQELLLLRALAGTGIRLPGTRFVLRVARINYAFFEERTGSFLSLPNFWMEGVSLVNDQGKVWIGRRHPTAKKADFDLSNMRETPSGFISNAEFFKAAENQT